MPTVSEVARVTTRDGAIWRTCAGCGLLAAMPVEVDRCDVCQASGSPVAVRVAGWLLMSGMRAGARLDVAGAFELLAVGYEVSAPGLAAELWRAAALLRGGGRSCRS